MQDGRKRNRGFEATHEAIIAATVKLISEKGVEALSMVEIARVAGINRATLYYHFDSREMLIAAVKLWSSTQLARGFQPGLSQAERITTIAHFVLDNPELIKLWFEDFVSEGDIRDRYPRWDDLVNGTVARVQQRGEAIDAEIYCIMQLTAAFIAPRIYHLSIRPDLPLEEVVERFRKEQLRVLARDAIYGTGA